MKRGSVMLGMLLIMFLADFAPAAASELECESITGNDCVDDSCCVIGNAYDHPRRQDPWEICKVRPPGRRRMRHEAKRQSTRN